MERFAYEELHIIFFEGDLHLSTIPPCAQALLAEQACHCLVGGRGTHAHHLLIGFASISRHTFLLFVMVSMLRPFPMHMGGPF